MHLAGPSWSEAFRSPARRCRPKRRRDYHAEGSTFQQEVFRTSKAWWAYFRLVPDAAGSPSEQRRDHGGKVRRLKAYPRLAQDLPALTLIIDAR
jgi:hypothetical protein